MGLTKKILPYSEDKKLNVIVIISLTVSILVTNSLIFFSPDNNSRFYFSGLTSTLTLGVALAVSILMVYKYKRNIKLEKRNKPFYGSAWILNPFSILTIIRSISLYVYFLYSGYLLR